MIESIKIGVYVAYFLTFLHLKSKKKVIDEMFNIYVKLPNN